MKRFTIILLLLFTSSQIFQCNNSDENKVKLAYPELVSLITNSNLAQSYYFFGVKEIDQSLTTNCGIATPGTAATTTPGQPPATTTTDPGTSNTRFTVLSQLFMKTTGEALTMKFLYDTVQTQGSLDQQQGFTLTGGVFNKTITGKVGTVRWTGQGAGYIDEASKGQQQLTFLNITINLRGFYSDSSATSTLPLECFTQDQINCTTVSTSSKCFTQDNKTCVAGNTGGQTVTVSGSIKCNAQNVIPQ